ncbi:MAG: kynureninase [Pseudomonadota bacterium]
MIPTRADCLALDVADPLAFARERFTVPDGIIYLDGNSLGPLPKATAERLRRTVEEEWGQGLIRSWNEADWINAPARLGAKIARLIGARPHEVVAADSTSVNLYKLAAAAAALRPERSVILTEPGNFPTDLYVLQGLAEQSGHKLRMRTVVRDALMGALDSEVAVLVLTHVHYKSGAVHDMAALTARAHEVGALTVWDLSHSTGALPVELNAAGADFAVGCGYKYLNGGPGAPAFLYVAERWADAARSPLSGWMGHAAPFEFVDDYQPASGVARMLCGTPSILAMAALEAGLATFDGVDMAQVRAKSAALSELFIALVEAKLPGVFELASPREPALRGSQVSLAHPHGYAIMSALIETGVIGDFRAPDILRFGFTPLYTRYVDVFDAVERLCAVMADRRFEHPRYAERAAVT